MLNIFAKVTLMTWSFCKKFMKTLYIFFFRLKLCRMLLLISCIWGETSKCVELKISWFSILLCKYPQRIVYKWNCLPEWGRSVIVCLSVCLYTCDFTLYLSKFSAKLHQIFTHFCFEWQLQFGGKWSKVNVISGLENLEKLVFCLILYLIETQTQHIKSINKINLYWFYDFLNLGKFITPTNHFHHIFSLNDLLF